MNTEIKSQYDTQAENFLASNNIKFRAVLSDSKPAPWAMDEKPFKTEPHHFRVTLSKSGQKVGSQFSALKNFRTDSKRITFDFWSSIADAEKGIETASAYSVLAWISSDANCPTTFDDFCSEYGYESDSIKALQTFRRCSSFAKRLNAFFTPGELNQLAEIN